MATSIRHPHQGRAAIPAQASRFSREQSIGVGAALALALLAVALVLAGIVGGITPPNSFTEGDNGRTVTVAAGRVITIELPGNPTTGFSWAATVGNPSMLREVSPPVYTPSSRALGGGGNYTFQYKVGAAGQTDLTLVYRRSWETGVAPLKTFKLTVFIQ
jgi:inhibitor of cysteine peptidase